MKKPILMIIAYVVLLSVSSFAYAAPELYFSGNVGLAFPSDADFCTPLLAGNPEIESDNGLALAIAAGYDFGLTRIECELAWQKNDLDTITILTEFDEGIVVFKARSGIVGF